MADADTGRYFWKLCVLQHTFFMKYEQNQVHPSVEQNLNLFQNVPEDLNESRDNLFVGQSTNNIYASDSHIPASLMWNQPNQMPSNQQRAESIVSSNMSLAASQQLLRTGGYNDQNCTPTPNDLQAHRNSNWQLVGSNTSLNNGRTQSTSCLDLSNNNVHHERERLKALLPGYRPAPDYETAVSQKYRSSEFNIFFCSYCAGFQFFLLFSLQIHKSTFTQAVNRMCIKRQQSPMPFLDNNYNKNIRM